MDDVSRERRRGESGAAPAQRIAIRRLRLRLAGVTPAAAREVALGVARALAAAVPGAAGLETNVRLLSRAGDSAGDLTGLSQRVAAALVRPRPTGAR